MADFLAVDLGATSGRVAIGRFDGKAITLEIAHRFTHEVITIAGTRCWDWKHIYQEVITGITVAKAKSDPTSIAIDSWAVDYGFIDAQGELIEPVVSYRDSRTEKSYPETLARLGKAAIYEATGIQFLPFNTIYQLASAKGSSAYNSADEFLLLPDLINYLLTGVKSTEITNASTTQLLNTASRMWDETLISELGFKRSLFTKLHEPGSYVGIVTGHPGLDGLKVVATASHDTASAVAGTPLVDTNSEGYISSGTWSLVGVEIDAPLTNKAAQEANLTNELGAAGTVRLLKNVTGMWLLEECRRTWHEEGRVFTIPELLSLAESHKPFHTTIDPNDPIFLAPGNMPQRIQEWCTTRKLQPPKTPAEFTLCILQSLAVAYKETLDRIMEISGKRINTIHILGGGSQIRLLNQLTANICGVPVKSGPVEATLYGNIAVQVIAAGLLPDLASARSAISESFTGEIFTPSRR